MGPKTCPFMNFGPSLWTLNGFGPLFFLIRSLNALFFLGFNHLLCIGPWYNIVIFWTLTFSPPNSWVACSPRVSRQDFLISMGIPSLLFKSVLGFPFPFLGILLPHATFWHPGFFILFYFILFFFTCYTSFGNFPSLHGMW